jgi:T5SS/PEP-CTERM-associated repeat protein
MPHLFRREAAAVRCLLLGVAVCSAAAPARATDVTWIDSGGGSFSDEGNWTPDLPFSSDVPGVNDIAHFGLTASSVAPPKIYTVTFDADHTNQRLVVEDDRVTFDLNGHTYRATSPIAVVLGTVSGRLGQIAVIDGILSTPLEADIEVGSVAGGFGTLQVSTGGLVLGSPEIIVGVNGGGQLGIFNGGDVIADAVTLGKNAGSTGTATITGASSSLLTTDLTVGSSGPGVLNVNASGRVDSTSGALGDLVGSTGTANVDGVNSKWNLSSGLVIGRFGSGALNITGGGRVDSRSGALSQIGTSGGMGRGDVTVSGPGSRWVISDSLVVGYEATGTLSITDGGEVRSARFSSIGELDGASTSTVAVDGANSQWINTGTLSVGRRSPGTLTITGGAKVENQDATIAELAGAADSAVIVSDPGSQWTVSSIDVGLLGSGQLKVLAGGRVDVASNVNIGGDGIGEVLVDGPASALIVDGELKVGVTGAGTLTISGGGVVQCATAKMPSSFTFGSAVVSVVVSGAGSTWAIGDDLFGGPSAFVGGTLRIQSGGLVTVEDTITLNDADELHLEGGALRTRTIEFLGAQEPFFWGAGRLSVDEIQIDTLIYNAGNVLAPGRELGETFVDGDLIAEPGGATEIQIGGTTPGVTFDRVRVTGSITITNGTLEVSMLNGFVPSPTDAFTVMSSLSGAFTGSFFNVASGQRLATSDGVGSFLVSYGPGSPQVVLSAFQPGIPGDFDVDGDVDGADFLKWQRGGSPNPNSAGDLTAWRGNFGFGGLTAAGASIPEPRAEVLALSLTLFAVLSQRRPTPN